MGCLACNTQNPRSFFAEERRHRFFVQGSRRTHATRLHCAQFAFEEPLALLESAHLGRHHPQEIAHFLLAEAPTNDVELGRTYGRR